MSSSPGVGVGRRGRRRGRGRGRRGFWLRSKGPHRGTFIRARHKGQSGAPAAVRLYLGDEQAVCRGQQLRRRRAHDHRNQVVLSGPQAREQRFLVAYGPGEGGHRLSVSAALLLGGPV